MLISPLNAVYPAWWVYLLPALFVIIVILGIIGLIAFGYLLGRKKAITFKTGGAIAIALASILLLSGVWCIFLSPTTTYTETKESFSRSLSLQGYEAWSHVFSLDADDVIDGSVNLRFDMLQNDSQVFSVYVYDPNDNSVFSDINVSYSYFNVKALESGGYLVFIENPNSQKIDVYLYISVWEKLTIRPLEPVGTWLALISLPIFGLGIWISIASKPKTKEVVLT